MTTLNKEMEPKVLSMISFDLMFKLIARQKKIILVWFSYHVKKAAQN
jgi:hypothetical protein